MPDKEGSDEKSTKSVVSKKQKQMMGEEGYDIARDMGRVRPSKDKKDATTMPPSKEMEKTRKVNKGPSALDIVKKKYKGQIMNVKKEEPDLTQVAEAFGGFIVEAPKKPKPGSFEFSKELGPKGKYQTSNIVKRMMQAFPPPGTGGKIGSDADAEVEKLITTARQDKKAAQIVGRDALTDKITGGGKPPKSGTGSSKRDKADITGIGGRNRPPVTGGKPRSTDDSELVQQTFPGFETPKKQTKPKRTYTRRQTPEQQAASNKNRKETRAQNKRKAQEKAGQQTIDFDQFVDQAKKQVQDIKKQPAGKTAKQVFTRTFLTPKKGVRGLVGKVVRNPVGTAIAAGIARDSFRNPLPQIQIPTVKGGKVGKRTAG